MQPEETPLHDPDGPPVSAFESIVDKATWVGFAALVVTGLVLGPAILNRGATRGASRSSRLRWQERQEEITRAIGAQTVAEHVSQTQQ